MTASAKPNPTGVATITLGWVVLDRPDQSGIYIAKDLAAGWAYLIADEDGDNRHRGQGPCAGGADVALRCAFLAAIACVPECTRLRLIVDTRLAHRVMVNLAIHDARVAGAIGGRQASVMTRPLERSTLLVQAAAERAASDKLRERERSEWHDVPVHAEATTEIPAFPHPAPGSGLGPVSVSVPSPTWRQRQAALQGAEQPVARSMRALCPGPAIASPDGATQPGTTVPARPNRLFGPLLDGAGPVAAIGRLFGGHPKAARNEALSTWLRDLDSQIDHVRTDLKDVGA